MIAVSSQLSALRKPRAECWAADSKLYQAPGADKFATESVSYKWSGETIFASKKKQLKLTADS